MPDTTTPLSPEREQEIRELTRGVARMAPRGWMATAAELLAEIDRLRNELEAHKALELGAVDHRVSAACSDPAHPTWLRKPDDTRGCPRCELEARPSRAEAQAEVAAWLCKKAREFPTVRAQQEATPAYLERLADKIMRGAVRPTGGAS